MDTIAILFNPSSGRGKSSRKRPQIEAKFKQYNIPCEWFTTENEDHLKALAPDLARRFPVLITVGGDTTFNLAAAEILRAGANVAMGMIGVGSANDICRGLGLYKQDDLCRAIKRQSIRKMDVGRIAIKDSSDPIYFLGALSLGLGVEVNRYICDIREKFPLLKRGGSTVQAITGVMAVQYAFSQQNVPAKVNLLTTEMQQEAEFSLLVFINIPYYANGIKLVPTASAFDGKIYCCVISTSSFLDTMARSRQLVGGRHVETDWMQIIPGTSFEISGERKIDIQYDGEILPNLNHFNVSVFPSALKVLTPL